MKKILLACNLGMSTSLLVRNMEKYAQQIGVEVQIAAEPIAVAEKTWKEWDIIMLGPQVRHVFNRLKDATGGEIPIVIIDMRDYGMMNGEKVLKAALDQLRD
ncbi:PTS sugar transporter subunit IIB [Candidatus Stoquefichus massiliensis]|uniref:PTS sugar transporter subunit IIB n=1 Tax=Candidatus Stoquefichus massiliensis TaxID=1470350 RepID=UPI000487AB4D|nr:PTS sugar transporter subunit IIB [Candidatus Stoquefichus massiliensis]